MQQCVITANRLADGVVVWLDAAESWVDKLGSAAVFTNDDAAASAEALQRRDRNVAIDIRTVPVETADGSPVPVARRERLRSVGPSVRTDLATAAPGERWAARPLPEPPSTTSASPFAGIYRYDEYDRQLRDALNNFAVRSIVA